MSALIRMELGKLTRLTSVRFTLVALTVFPILWAYAPGIFDVYGLFLVSGFQVPALSLLSGMEFLMPLLVAIAAAELLGIEVTHGTLPTVLLRPVTRSQWLATKLTVMTVYPFGLMAFFLLTSLVAGVPYGFGRFTGGTGLGQGGLTGEGLMAPAAAFGEILGAYAIAAVSLVPIALLALLATVVFMNAAGGALATMSVLIFMQLLVVFPALEPFLLTSHLSAYAEPVAGMGWTLTLIALYSAAFAAVAVVLFERKDF